MPHVPIHSHLRSWLLLVLAAAGPILGSLSATAAEAKKEEAKPADSTPWWNKEWTVRKKVVVRPDVPAAPLKEATGPLLVLLRLHEGVKKKCKNKNNK